MLRPGHIAQPCPPYIGCEIKSEEAEEEAGHFKPKDTADSSEGPQEAADASPEIARCGSSNSPGLPACRSCIDCPPLSRAGCSGTLLRLCLSGSGRSLLGDSSGYPNTDSQPFSHLFGLHLHLKCSSACGWTRFCMSSPCDSIVGSSACQFRIVGWLSRQRVIFASGEAVKLSETVLISHIRVLVGSCPNRPREVR